MLLVRICQRIRRNGGNGRRGRGGWLFIAIMSMILRGWFEHGRSMALFTVCLDDSCILSEAMDYSIYGYVCR